MCFRVLARKAKNKKRGLDQDKVTMDKGV